MVNFYLPTSETSYYKNSTDIFSIPRMQNIEVLIGQNFSLNWKFLLKAENPCIQSVALRSISKRFSNFLRIKKYISEMFQYSILNIFVILANIKDFL